MPSVFELQHSLSILYQPLYGRLESSSVINISPSTTGNEWSDSLGRNTYPNNLPDVLNPYPPILGMFTTSVQFNEPIDFVSWAISGGYPSFEWFNRCSLFYTHM